MFSLGMRGAEVAIFLGVKVPQCRYTKRNRYRWSWMEAVEIRQRIENPTVIDDCLALKPSGELTLDRFSAERVECR
jgi:hypothetical protein